jgi:hypothetical protein
MDSNGDITRWVVSSPQRVLSLSTVWPAALCCAHSTVLCRASDVAAELLQRLTLVSAPQRTAARRVNPFMFATNACSKPVCRVRAF